MSATIAVRSATTNDLPAVLLLYSQLNSDDETLSRDSANETFAKILAHPGLTVFLGLHDDRPVATATLNVIPNLTRNGRPYALIENVVCLESHRGLGLGKAVVGHAVDAAWQSGCYKAMLLTGRKDEAIHRFYEACGFLQNKTGYQIRRTS